MPIEACLPLLGIGSRIIAHSPGDISPIRLWILSDRLQVHPSTIDKGVWWLRLKPTSYSKFNKLDTMVRLTKSYEENHVISCLQTWNQKIKGKLLEKNIPWRDYSSFWVPASRFQVHATRFRVPTPVSGPLPPGLGPCLQLPGRVNYLALG